MSKNHNSSISCQNNLPEGPLHPVVLPEGPLHPVVLPEGFVLKTLNLTQLDEICNFLNSNYTEQSECGIRTIFGKDYIYWYLKHILPGFIIGLTHKCKLVGFVTVLIMDIMINGTISKIPYINFLCVHYKLRKLGLAHILINHVKLTVYNSGYHYGLYVNNNDEDSVSDDLTHSDSTDTLDTLDALNALDSLDSLDALNALDSLDSLEENSQNTATVKSLVNSEKNINNSSSNLFCRLKLYAIPINYKKLISVEFLPMDYKPIDNSIYKKSVNPFHLMKESDLKSVTKKINIFMDQFKIRSHFTIDTARHFLIPRKNIIYSFVKKNDEGVITDFISMYKSCVYSTYTKKIIYTANITYYFYETLTLTEMINLIMIKLPSYKIDQIIFNTMGNNSTINITKFLTNVQDCFFYKPNYSANTNLIDIPNTPSNQIMFGNF